MHIDGNNMTKLQAIIGLYLWGDIEYEEAKKKYNNIIDIIMQRARN